MFRRIAGEGAYAIQTGGVIGAKAPCTRARVRGKGCSTGRCASWLGGDGDPGGGKTVPLVPGEQEWAGRGQMGVLRESGPWSHSREAEEALARA